MYVSVLIANEFEKVKVCEVYEVPQSDDSAIDKVMLRFDELKKIYGGANVCMASREVIK